ncbi:MAG: ATP-dependent zinc metalloprotease FtsH [Armatimonadota bacterium]
MNKHLKNIIFLAVIVAVFMSLRAGWDNREGSGQPKRIEISQAWQLIEQEKVVEAVINRDQLTLINAKNDRYITVLPPEPQERAAIQELMRNKRVEYKIEKPLISDAVMSSLLMILLPLGILVFLWILFMRQAQSGGSQAMAFGRSRAKRMSENVPKVTFDDVAGVDEAKQELQEVVEFLKNPKKFQALGAKIPKGVLLLGSPGCGKTLLARAIAGEAGVPFFHISGSDFVEMFVGVGASRVRDLFETAKANKPSLVFIDEIDAVGRQRGAGLGGGHDEREQTLNQLLVEMDGFDPNSGVILIAATNRPDVLDPALLRPGRFDRRVIVDNPDAKGREAILNVHIKGKPLADDVDINSLARRTPGFSGADLANLVNEAALMAARKDQTKICMADFEYAVDRVVAGPERKSRALGEKEKEMVAYHEVGHALVSELLPLADPVHKVSILPRGMALGYTMQLPAQDKYLITKSEFMDKIAGLLGGRVAEELVFNETSTGASNDLQRATETVRAMVCEYGMSDKIGPITLGKRHGNPFLGRDLMEDRNYSEEVAIEIDKEIKNIIENAHERARTILEENRQKMEDIVKVLKEKETLEREEFLSLLEGATLTGITGKQSECIPESVDDTVESENTEQADAKKSPESKPRLEPGIA